MVPPPKRRIGEDTPLVDMSHAHNEYSIANYTGQFAGRTELDDRPESV